MSDDESPRPEQASTPAAATRLLPAWRSPSGRFKAEDFRSLQFLRSPRSPFFVGNGSITRKDKLLRNLRKFKAVYGSVFNYYPETYTLPVEYEKFVTAFCAKNEADPGSIWIGKPADLSRGRGIFLFKDLAQLQYNTQYVVQKYVDNPLLISGFKFDLRLYVLVTSLQPLRVFLYRDGLARFSTQRYDKSALDNLFAHLTNSSINKHSPTLLDGKGAVGPGCKWSFAELWAHLRKAGVDLDRLWSRVRAIVCLTVLTLAEAAKKGQAAFELYGFDVLLDANLKPWLLEVNASPALGSDCPADVAVKEPMLADLLEALEGEDRLDAAAAAVAPRARPAAAAPPRARPPPRSASASAPAPASPPGPEPAAPPPSEPGGSGLASAASGPAGGPAPPDFVPPDGRPSRYGGFELVLPFSAATHEIVQRGAGEAEARALVGQIKLLDGGGSASAGEPPPAAAAPAPQRLGRVPASSARPRPAGAAPGSVGPAPAKGGGAASKTSAAGPAGGRPPPRATM